MSKDTPDIDSLINDLADDTRYRINKISSQLDPLLVDPVNAQMDLINKLSQAIRNKNLNEVPEPSNQMLLFS